jgi:hypothetical protein
LIFCRKFSRRLKFFPRGRPEAPLPPKAMSLGLRLLAGPSIRHPLWPLLLIVFLSETRQFFGNRENFSLSVVAHRMWFRAQNSLFLCDFFRLRVESPKKYSQKFAEPEQYRGNVRYSLPHSL